jgi:hypothetical protein
MSALSRLVVDIKIVSFRNNLVSGKRFVTYLTTWRHAGEIKYNRGSSFNGLEKNQITKTQSGCDEPGKNSWSPSSVER